MFAGFGSTNRPWNVQMIRQRIVDGFDLRIGQQSFVGTVNLGNPQGLGSLPGLGQRPRRNRRDFAALARLRPRPLRWPSNRSTKPALTRSPIQFFESEAYPSARISRAGSIAIT